MNNGYYYNYGGQYYQPAPPPPPVKKKSKKWIPFAIIGAYKLIVIIVVISIIVTVARVTFVSTSGNGVPTINGKTYFSIQTKSMYPIFSPGDLIIGDADFEVDDLKEGDIITYWTVINGERVINTHTIYEIYDCGDYRIFATKGENNTVVDSLTVHESEIVSVPESRVPDAGKVLDYLSTTQGFTVLVVVGIIAIVF